MDGPQHTWTNHLGIDSPCGRKLPRGVLYYAMPPAQCLDAVMRPLLEAAHHRPVAKPTPILFHRFDRVRDALKPMMTNAWAALQAPEQKTPRLLQWFRGVACALVSVVAASINVLASAMGLRTSDPTVEAVDELIGEPVPPMQQIRVKVDGATVMIDAATNWTENDVNAALAEKLRRSLGDDYYFVAGGKALNDGNGTTLGALGVVGRGCVLELRRRTRGGGCGASKAPAEGLMPTPGSVDLREAPSSSNQSSSAPQKPVPLTEEQRAKAAEAAAAVVMVPEPDPLTPEQRVEKAREAEAIAEEVDAPSKAPDDQQWDNKGCSALKAALKNTVLPDAAYLAQLADEGGTLPRNQDLPPGARVTLADMEKWDGIGGTVGALIISYPW